MIVLIIVGILSFICGAVFLMPEDKIKEMNTKMNKAILSMDHFFLTNHVGIGISLFVLSGFCFFMTYLYLQKVNV